MGLARQALRAKPVLEFVERDRKLNQMALGAPRQISYDQQGKAHSVAGDLEAARRARQHS